MPEARAGRAPRGLHAPRRRRAAAPRRDLDARPPSASRYPAGALPREDEIATTRPAEVNSPPSVLLSGRAATAEANRRIEARALGATATAIVVLICWAVIPAAIGGWRTVTRDA